MGGCYDCGLEYSGTGWIEAIIPDHIWDMIRPEGCDEGCGLLCITCMSRRLVKLNLKEIPVWLCGTEPLKAMAGNPGDNIELLRNWKCKRAIRGRSDYGHG